MRTIHWIVVHCSDSDIDSHDNIETIRKWHTLPKMPVDVAKRIKDGKLPPSEAFKYGRGWTDIGYHYFINKKGDVFPGRSESIKGSHVAGHNDGSLGICLSGRTGFTANQFRSLEALLKKLCQAHSLEKKDVLGHRDLNGGKTCPNFDVHELTSKYNWH